ncbi:hypothetical protein [Pseudarcicella hirudinis]|nr:hypothetical protein [Pseudarcicella hirudinis]
MFKRILVSLLFMSVIFACSSGKKALQNGNYDEAVLTAVGRLQKSPNNSSALQVLKEAYPLAVSKHTDRINQWEQSKEPFHWEKVVEEYQQLNQMADQIQNCPVCQNAVGTPQRNFQSLQSAKNLSADERYDAGQHALGFAQNNRQAAKDAFGHFKRAEYFVPNYKDVADKIGQAFELASVKIVVEQVTVTSRLYQLSNEYFQDRINEFLKTNPRLNQFVLFYSPQEASNNRLKPDQIVHLEFDDFVVGQTYVNSNTDLVTSRDSVKVGETKVNGKTIPVYNKVTARLTRTRKTVSSKGLLDMQIIDFRTKNVLYRDKIPGEFVWTNEWARFNGDERALTRDQLNLCNVREQLPPPPQQLFVEFSKPIYDQFTRKIRKFYENY